MINLKVSWSSFLLEKKKKFSVYLQKNKNNKNGLIK